MNIYNYYCFCPCRYSVPITKLSLTYFIPFIYSTLISRLCSFSFFKALKLYKSKPTKHGNACKRNILGGTKDRFNGHFISRYIYMNSMVC